ncbi:hypothetical protein [Lysobacter soyae]|uniref:Uncharacterized protein n=1 Tax=Lysobacter soyae TaxID=2764185 RepID=A0ABX8WMR8_9GAMM|nr:hypothetical protein [Lysobacter sp. CJ11]QYR52920.1 hypothetical protein H8L67_10185 [Lysobacter sp. CJ11]
MLSKAFMGAVLGAAILSASPAQAQSRNLDCKLTYSLSGWSLFYKRADGNGVVRCENGQTLNVKIRARGGGLTAGQSKIKNGHGEFSDVRDIREVLGTYATAEANAAAGDAVKGQVMTKGNVSLALSGKGKGVELGVAFGKVELIAN